MLIYSGEHKNSLQQNEVSVKGYNFRVRVRDWREGTLGDTGKLKGNDGPLEEDSSKEKTTTDSELGVGGAQVRGLNMRIKHWLMQQTRKKYFGYVKKRLQ